MSSLQEPCDSGSPSISKAEDNLSNSDGPLLKKNLGRNIAASSSENVPKVKSLIMSSRVPSRDLSSTSFDLEKKRYCLWTLICILAMIGFCNLILSITIIAVLRVSQGMESLEVIPNENLVKFYGSTDLDKVCIEEGICQGFGDEPVILSGDNSGVQLNIKNRRHDHPRANMDILQNGTSVSKVESFEIKDLHTGHSIFSTNFPNFGLPSGVGNINVKLAETHRIVSPVNETLNLESNKEVTIRGAESLSMESKEIIWMADNDVKLQSNNSVIMVNGKNGVYLDVKKIPIALGMSNDGDEIAQYKVCICMPQGKLFRLPVPTKNLRVNCAKISNSPEHNPCL
ncbi:hypothetical protein PV325_012075 [Microctonus aethiopoides]|nr:hypothetical protein PV325_012075 [Microctonus aethiopoides]